MKFLFRAWTYPDEILAHQITTIDDLLSEMWILALQVAFWLLQNLYSEDPICSIGPIVPLKPDQQAII